MSDARAVLVYGATGLTGGLVLDALLARGVQPWIAGRSRGKLRALAASRRLGNDAVVVADAVNALDVAQMVDRAKVVVACAGPFTAVGEPTVAACAARGVFYADSSNEASFVQTVARRYDATARVQSCALAPAMGFEVALADAAAERAAEGMGDGVAIDVAYAITGGASSPGRRASTAMILGHGGLAFEAGALRSEPLGARLERVPFAPPLGESAALSFPSPEVVTVPMHVPARAVHTLAYAPRAELLQWVGRAVAPLTERASPVLRRVFERAGQGNPSRSALAATQWQVVVTARALDGRTRRVSASGRDPYTISGALLAEAALAMARGEVKTHGVLAPSQVLGAERILAVVSAFEGTRVRVD